MVTQFPCARCGLSNPAAVGFCEKCGLPLGSAQADASAGRDALGVYEAPDPSDSGLGPQIRDLAVRSGFPAEPFGHGWRVLVQLPMDRSQAVYIGPEGTDRQGRPLIGLVTVCGPASERHARTLLKMNARAVDGHFAIKTLRGEEYFVVCRTMLPDEAVHLDAQRLCRQIAEEGDGLEGRLSRGRDLY